MRPRVSPGIIVFASGEGSGFESIAQAIEDGRLKARILGVLSDRPQARVLERAARRKIPTVVVPAPARGPELLEKLAPWTHPFAEARESLFIVLAGYMRLLDATFLSAWDSGSGYARVINIHPSLLPAFAGRDAYRQAFEHGVKVTGVTIHLVTLGMDEGPICAQRAFEMGDCTSVEEVQRRGQSIEHALYPETLQWVVNEAFELRGPNTGHGGRPRVERRTA